MSQLIPFVPSSSSASSRAILTRNPLPTSKEGRRLGDVTSSVDVSSETRCLAQLMMPYKQSVTYWLLDVLLSIECMLSRLLLQTLGL